MYSERKGAGQCEVFQLFPTDGVAVMCLWAHGWSAHCKVLFCSPLPNNEDPWGDSGYWTGRVFMVKVIREGLLLCSAATFVNPKRNPCSSTTFGVTLRYVQNTNQWYWTILNLAWWCLLAPKTIVWFYFLLTMTTFCFIKRTIMCCF